MNTQNFINDNQASFTCFLFQNRSNRLMLYLSTVAIIIQFAIFKYLYPFANFIHNDSFVFLNAADKNLTINFYPIGYSKLLRLVNIFAKPDFALVMMQYLFIQCSLIVLLFTIYYLTKTGKLTQWILLIFMVGNPLILHLANLVSNDAVFLSLSCIWFTLLLWIIHRPSTKVIIWHAVILVLVFTVSYNAFIYPFISILAFRLSALPIGRKLSGWGLGVLLCTLFTLFNILQYKQLTGYWQFSPYNSWQVANNALFAYRKVNSANRTPVASEYQAFDKVIRNYFYQTRYVTFIPTKKKQWETTYYMWAPQLPLMQYSDSLFNIKEPKASEFKKWASMGPFYSAYGWYIIQKYPMQFTTYVLWPNAKKYFAPSIEVLESYNGEKKTVTDETQSWFGYTKVRIKTRMWEPDISVLNFYPSLSASMNLIMLFGLIYFLLLKGWRYNSAFNKTLIMGSVLLLLNAVFTITISTTALRLQSFPIMITTTIALLLVDWMVQLMKSMKMQQSKQTKMQEHFSNEVIA